MKSIDMLRDSLIGYQAVTGEDMGAFLLHADEIEAEIAEVREITRKKHQTERVYWHNELHKILDAINGRERYWGNCMDYPLPEATIPPSEVAKRMLSERYMLLPVDADGVPIHVGDICEMNGERFEVRQLKTDGDCWWAVARIGECYLTWYCRHVKPRTLEDVLTEMLDRNTDGVGLREFNRDFGAFVAHYAAEIRELLSKAGD